uniref:Uncharacterized protein n=1 Tax=Globodera rostochiensis TaxID=31243 RepID=A0A914HAA9_GLORO
MDPGADGDMKPMSHSRPPNVPMPSCSPRRPRPPPTSSPDKKCPPWTSPSAFVPPFPPCQPKWRPRMTLASLLPVFQQLGQNGRCHAPSMANGMARNRRHPLSPSELKQRSAMMALAPPSPPMSAFLSRSQSVTHRVEANAELIRDLALR